MTYLNRLLQKKDDLEKELNKLIRLKSTKFDECLQVITGRAPLTEENMRVLFHSNIVKIAGIIDEIRHLDKVLVKVTKEAEKYLRKYETASKNNSKGN